MSSDFISPQQLMASAGDGSEIVLWAAAVGRPVQKLEAEDTTEVVSLAFHPLDPNVLVSASAGKVNLSVWDVQQGKRVKAQSLPDMANCVSFNSDGSLICVACDDSNCYIFDTEKYEQFCVLRAQANDRWAVHCAFSPQDPKMCCVSVGKQHRLWRVGKQPELLTVLPRPGDSITWAWFSCWLPDGRTILDSDNTGVRFWPIHEKDDGGVVGAAGEHNEFDLGATCLIATAGGLIGSDVDDKSACLFSAEGEHARLQHPDAVTAAMFSADGRWFITACEDHKVRIWSTASVRSGGEVVELLREFDMHAIVKCVAVPRIVPPPP